MTTTDFEIVLDEQLDFPVACDYSVHGKFGPEELPAEWIVKLAASPCGCKSPRWLLMCEPCKTFRVGNGDVICTTCGEVHPNGDVLGVERL